jgi:hypothetical protein
LTMARLPLPPWMVLSGRLHDGVICSDEPSTSASVPSRDSFSARSGTERFTHRTGGLHTERLVYTQNGLHTERFTHRTVYTQNGFTHRTVYTQNGLHTERFEHTEFNSWHSPRLRA